jgi:hypothetical protein
LAAWLDRAPPTSRPPGSNRRYRMARSDPRRRCSGRRLRDRPHARRSGRRGGFGQGLAGGSEPVSVPFALSSTDTTLIAALAGLVGAAIGRRCTYVPRGRGPRVPVAVRNRLCPRAPADEGVRVGPSVAPYLCGGPASSARSGVVRVELRSAGGACARLMVRVVCARAPSLTSVHDPRVGSGAGDMMFDGVIPLGEALRPLGLSGPSTRA